MAAASLTIEKPDWQFHLFVRDTKLHQDTAASFIDSGRANDVMHAGSAPMSVTLALQMLVLAGLLGFGVGSSYKINS